MRQSNDFKSILNLYFKSLQGAYISYWPKIVNLYVKHDFKPFEKKFNFVCPFYNYSEFPKYFLCCNVFGFSPSLRILNKMGLIDSSVLENNSRYIMVNMGFCYIFSYQDHYIYMNISIVIITYKYFVKKRMLAKKTINTRWELI